MCLLQRYLFTFAILFVTLGAVDPPTKPESPGPAPSASKSEGADAPIPLFLDGPDALGTFWTKLQSPDFVLLRGDRYEALLKAGAVSTTNRPSEPIISRVEIRGKADAKTTELVVSFVVNLSEPGTRWVPLKLTGLSLSSVKEADRQLLVRNVNDSGWEVELAGQGNHKVEVSLVSGVVTNGEERRFEMTIPLAATTTVGLDIDEEATEAALGSRDPVRLVRRPPHGGVRLDASITPRTRVEITWRVPREQSTALQPLLSVQGEIAIDVAPDSIRSRVRSTIAAVRGTTRELSFSFDADEEILDVEFDNRALPVDSLVVDGVRNLTIPLAEPLRQGSPPRNLAITTLRKHVTKGPTAVVLKGYALRNATLQTGVLSITQNGAIWIEGVAGRGLLRIDPANELPNELRSRPGTVLSYRFVEQPFHLSLRVEPSPPILEARVKTTVTLSPESSTSDHVFAFRGTPGQVFGVQFRIPEGVILEPIRADETIESSNLAIEATKDVNPTGVLPRRLLRLRLTPRAHTTGLFTVKLSTRQGWTPGDSASLALVEPLNTTPMGGRIAIRRAVGIEIDTEKGFVGPTGETSFHPSTSPPANEWTWPEAQPSGLEPDILWLAYDGLPDALPIVLKLNRRSLRSEIGVTAKVSRTGIDYRETFHLDAINGLVPELKLIVPAGVDRTWSIEGTEISARELIETSKDGSRLYRIVLTKGAARSVDLRFLYRTTFDTALGTSPGQFVMIGLASDADGRARLAYETEPGIDLRVDRGTWREQLAPLSFGAERDGRSERLVLTQTTQTPLPSYVASAAPLLSLPQLLVGRTLLRTLVGPDESRTTATFRLERHGDDLIVRLPSDARWVQAKIDGRPITSVEKVDETSRYRILLPKQASATPTLLSVDYAIASRSTEAWTPPLVEIAVFQPVYWELLISSNSALMGVPAGWSDENEWYWDRFVWMRKPSLSSVELREWVSGPGRATEGPSEDFTYRTNSHAYLFRRTDGLRAMPVTIASRVMLLGLCSGGAGLVGILLVLLRPSYRLVILTIGLAGFVLALGWDPNVTFQVVQSGILGIVLALSAAGLQRVVDRRGSRTRKIRGIAESAVTSHQISTNLIAQVGSDDSTAIRSRPHGVPNAIVIPPPAIEPNREATPSASGRPT